MSVDREYKVRIQLLTEGDGGRAAEELQDVGKAAEKAGEGMQVFEAHGREFSKFVRLIDQVAPGAGVALKALFNPATLGLGATVFLLEHVIDALKEYNQKLDEAGQAAAKADFASSIEAAVEATRDANAEQEKYLANLHESERGEHGIAVELSNQLQLIAAIAAARQASAEAEHTLALARLKEKEVSGAVNPTQAALERQRIEDQYIRDKRAADERKFQEEQVARTRAATGATDKQFELDQKQTAAENALEQARAKKKAAIDHGEKVSPEALQAAQTAADEAREAVSKWNYRLAKMLPGFMNTPEARQKEAAAAQTEATLQTLSEIKRKETEAKATNLTPLELAAEQAKKEADANATAATAAAAARDQAQHQHDATGGDNAAADRAATATDAANTRTELMNRARTLQRSETQGTLSPQDVAELLQLMRILGERFFEQGENAVTQQQFKQEVQALRRLIESKK
jgi:hypothetical protein